MPSRPACLLLGMGIGALLTQMCPIVAAILAGQSPLDFDRD